MGGLSLLQGIFSTQDSNQGFLCSSVGKDLPATQETWVQFLGQGDPLEKEMATRSSILTWRIPMDRGTWWATVHRIAELDMTEAT